MRRNVTDTPDQGSADVGTWETVEITPVARVAAIRRQSTMLVGALLVVGAVAGAGLWPVDSAIRQTDSGTGPCLATTTSTPAVHATIDAGPPVAASVDVTPWPLIVVLMPAEGEVILGPVIAVAGRISGPGPGPARAQPGWLHVAIVVDDGVIGEADLQVIGRGFVGSVPVVERARGQSVDMRVSDPRRPDRALLEQRFTLGPGG